MPEQHNKKDLAMRVNNWQNLIQYEFNVRPKYNQSDYAVYYKQFADEMEVFINLHVPEY